MTLFPVLVDVYHKEQLVTREEAEKAASNVQKWEDVAVTKDVATAARIADILHKYGWNNGAKHIRGMCVLSSVCINTVQDPFEKTQYLEY